MVGYADPFAGLGASNPLSGGNPAFPLSTQLTLTANSILRGVATGFGAKFVDIYTPFVGNETRYSYIADPTPLPGGSPNFHPNATGYNVIARQIAATAAAPEPGALSLLSIVAIPGAVRLARRKRARKEREA